MNNKTNPTTSNLEAYEYGQQMIRRMLKQCDALLEKHDKDASGKVGGHSNADVQDMQDVVGMLIEAKKILNKVNKK